MNKDYKLFGPPPMGDHQLDFYPGWQEAIECNKKIKALFLNGKEIEVIKHKPKETKFPQYYHVCGNEVCLYLWHQLVKNTKKNKIKLESMWKKSDKIRALKKEINLQRKKLDFFDKE